MKKNFSFKKRLNSFKHAKRGILLVIKSQHNFWIHIFCAFLVVLLGSVLKISESEWVVLIILISIVLITEAINTSIEFTLDCVSKEHREDIRDAKDVASGAVLISAICAILGGLIIFIPKII